MKYKRTDLQDLNIVPFNSHLLLLTECHINVEIASTVNLIMYLYKYLFKGGDSALFAFVENEEPVNEIKDYVKGRYLSAMEAAWRISAYHISEKTLSVECLKIHLPGKARNFTKNKVLSPLERYFSRPHTDPYNTMTYTAYHDSSTFKSLTNREIQDDMDIEDELEGCVRQQVKLRERGEKISRIQKLYPSAGEIFYLRILLLHKHCRTFEDLLTVDGVELKTFQGAAEALGLIEHGDEGNFALNEAIQQQ